MVGAAYQLSMAATGGLPPYTWSLISGNPPAGLSLSSAGELSGTPSAATTTNFTLRLTDDYGFSSTKAIRAHHHPDARFPGLHFRNGRQGDHCDRQRVTTTATASPAK